LLFCSKFKYALNIFIPYFFYITKYMYNSTQHILAIVPKSYANMSQFCANFISTWTTLNRSMMQVNLITISMSQRYWRLIFVINSFSPPKFYIEICLIGENMEIHLVFTLWSNFRPFLLRSVGRMSCSRCLFGEDEKCVYMVCNNPSSLSTKG
jgi:hypothetical protein